MLQYGTYSLYKVFEIVTILLLIRVLNSYKDDTMGNKDELKVELRLFLISSHIVLQHHVFTSLFITETMSGEMTQLDFVCRKSAITYKK